MVDITQLNYSIPAINYLVIQTAANSYGSMPITYPSSSWGAYWSLSEKGRNWNLYNNSYISSSLQFGSSLFQQASFNAANEYVYTMVFDYPNISTASIARTNNYKQWLDGNFSITILASSSALPKGNFGFFYDDGNNLITASTSRVYWRPEGGSSVDNTWSSASVISIGTTSAAWSNGYYSQGTYYFGGTQTSSNSWGYGKVTVVASNTNSPSGTYKTINVGTASAGYAQLWNSWSSSVSAICVENSLPTLNTGSITSYITADNGTSWTRKVIASFSSTNSEQIYILGYGTNGNVFAVCYTMPGSPQPITKISTTTDGLTWNQYTAPNYIYGSFGWFLALRGIYILQENGGTTWMSNDLINWQADYSGILDLLSYTNIIF